MKKTIARIVLASLLILMVVLSGCTTGAPKDDAGTNAGTSTSSGNEAAKTSAAKPVKIGLEIPLTGRVASQGQMMKVAMDIAVAKVNKDGGINGSPVELVVSDDQMDPKQTVTEYRKLLNEDVVAVLGPMGSGNFQIVSSIANQQKVPTINPNGIKVGIAKLPWAMRTMPTDGDMIPGGVADLKKYNPNIKKAVILYDAKEPAMSSALPLYRAAAKAQGIQIAGEVSYQTGITDFSPAISKVKSYNSDAIFVAMMEAESVLASKEMERQGINVPVLSTMSTWAGAFVTSSGTSGKNWYTIGNFSNEPDPANQEAVDFANEFLENSKSNSTLKQPANISTSANVYDCFMIIVDVLRKANVNGDTALEEAREKLRQGIMQVKDYNGLTGKFTMKENGEGGVKTRVFKLDVDKQIWAELK